MTSVLHYALWPSLSVVILALWILGILDIDRHRRSGTSTNAGLLCMAVCVSLVAIFAIAGTGAVFADPWAKAVARGGPTRSEAGELQGQASTPIFSFGLEHAYFAPAHHAGKDDRPGVTPD